MKGEDEKKAEEKRAAKQRKKLAEARKYLAEKKIGLGGREPWKSGADIAATFERRKAELEEGEAKPEVENVTPIKGGRK